MPIYEYSCKKCGAHLEVMQKISDAPLARHAKCGGKLEKEWSRTGFQFKGSGWYVTDYAGKKSEESKETKESKESKADAKSESVETKSDSAETKAADSKESKAKGSKSKKDAAATSGD